MANIGLLGFGTVGMGVFEILNSRFEELREATGEEIRIKKILVKDKSKKRNIDEGYFTVNFEDILKDQDIDILVEVTGDIEKSYEYIRAGLENGKHIVTANKGVVSKYFYELSNLAEEEKLGFLYEASVGGGIPIIKPLKSQVYLNEIEEISGILNGTCNYILSKMMVENRDYEEVLKEAQDLGYAESDPSADVEGYDSLRKLRILGSIAMEGEVLEEDIYLDGINNIKAFDISFIKNMQRNIKLLGRIERLEDGYMAALQPCIVGESSPFYNVNDVYNSISLRGNNIGVLNFFGQGAGKLPTANAVLTDVVDIVMKEYSTKNPIEKLNLKNYNAKMRGTYYLRISNLDKLEDERLNEFIDEKYIVGNSLVIVTREVRLFELKDRLKDLSLNGEDYFLARILD